jgi:hypothetical protein
MSIIGSPNSKNAATEAAPETAPLAPEQVVEQLRVLRERIPEFVQLPNNRETRQIRRDARLSVDFAHEAFNAVGASNVVQDLIGNSPDDLHKAEDEMARWTAVESELRAMLRGVAAANLVRRRRIGHAALQAYNVSSQLVKLDEHAHLLPHVERMRQLRKAGRRRAKPAAEAQPQQQSPPK